MTAMARRRFASRHVTVTPDRLDRFFEDLARAVGHGRMMPRIRLVAQASGCLDQSDTNIDYYRVTMPRRYWRLLAEHHGEPKLPAAYWRLRAVYHADSHAQNGA